MHRENNRFGGNIGENRVQMESSSRNPVREKREEMETLMSLTQPDKRVPYLNRSFRLNLVQKNRNASPAAVYEDQAHTHRTDFLLPQKRIGSSKNQNKIPINSKKMKSARQ